MQPHIDAIDTYVAPNSLTEWVAALKEALAIPPPDTVVWEFVKVKAKRTRVAATHCKRGHPYDGKRDKGGKHRCRVCKSLWDRTRYQEKTVGYRAAKARHEA